MKKRTEFPWIQSGWFDSLFILSPPFICLGLIALFPYFFESNNFEHEWLWLILVVFIDVGHVYSTIYRTYFDKTIILQNKTFFYLSPLLIYILGVVLYSFGPLIFWRSMAYLAVFHFVRQQYGFMRLYSRHEQKSIGTHIDTITIYSSTIYPLLYWHFSGKQLFNWFVDGDFIYVDAPAIIPFLTLAYISILSIYFIKEGILLFKHWQFNAPKNMLIVGTALSWYFGIVYFKGDLTFTLLNVVSHGIPYYALVWAHGSKRNKTQVVHSPLLKKIFQPQYILVFILCLLMFAYLEELIWDGFIWKEHFSIFPTSRFLPDISTSNLIMNFCVPLFALPQLLHYFIDGFIWKIRNDQFNWFKLLK